MLQQGDRIGNWVVDRLLGEGGMGAVFVAHHVLIPADVAAVKVLKPISMDNARERFIRELKLLRSLEHPAVVRLLEGGLDETRNLLYLAMELLEGQTLDARMAEGPIPAAEALPLFQRLAEGLDAAHQRGTFHRDLKPENIFLAATGPKLLDFGIAIQEGGTRYTSADLVPGTPTYMAPEIFVGDLPDPRLGDLYALGLMLGEALTGQQAFPIPEGLRPSQAQLRLISLKTTAGPFDIAEAADPAVRALVLSASHPQPAERPASLAPFLCLHPLRPEALIARLPHRGATPAEAPPSAPAGRPTGSVALAAGGAFATLVLAASALAAVAMGVLVVITWPPATPPETEPPAAVPIAIPEPGEPGEPAEPAERSQPLTPDPTPPTPPPKPDPKPSRPAPTTGPAPQPLPPDPVERPAPGDPLAAPAAPRHPQVGLVGDTTAVFFTSHAGRFTLPGPVPPGTYAIRADFGAGETRAGQANVGSEDTRLLVRCDAGFGMCSVLR